MHPSFRRYQKKHFQSHWDSPLLILEPPQECRSDPVWSTREWDGPLEERSRQDQIVGHHRHARRIPSRPSCHRPRQTNGFSQSARRRISSKSIVQCLLERVWTRVQCCPKNLVLNQILYHSMFHWMGFPLPCVPMPHILLAESERILWPFQSCYQN